MLDISFAELIVILLAIIIFVAPKNLPTVGREGEGRGWVSDAAARARRSPADRRGAARPRAPPTPRFWHSRSMHRTSIN